MEGTVIYKQTVRMSFALLFAITASAAVAQEPQTYPRTPSEARVLCSGAIPEESTLFWRCMEVLVKGATEDQIDAVLTAAEEMKYLLVVDDIVVGTGFAPIQQTPPTASEYTVDMAHCGRSNFALFGSTSGSHQVGIATLSAERGNWSADLIIVEGIGQQEYGELVDYVDLIPQHSREFGDFTMTLGSEFFYGPKQPGSQRTIFIAPLATIEWAPNDHVSLVLGGQYAATYKTKYEGDRSFLWLEPTFSVGERLKLSMSPGWVWADTGRHTRYLSGSLEWNVYGPLTVYTSYLDAKSWKMYDVDGIVRIEPTWAYGVKSTW